jgi:sugar (pentulose or hexulose) kinase
MIVFPPPSLHKYFHFTKCIEYFYNTDSGALQWLKSDVTGKPFSTTQIHDAELMGIAIILSYIEGIYPDIYTAWEKICSIVRVFMPDGENHRYYSDLYELYKTLRTNLSSCF